MKKNDFFDRIDSIKEKMYRIAYSYSKSQSMAIDAIDEAVYQGYIKRNQLKQDIFFETWIIRILINVCNRQFNDSKRFDDYDDYDDYDESVNQTESFNEEAITNLPLKMAVEKLPYELKILILLKFFGGYKTVEMADILEIPQGTVATRLRKALSLLKLELEES